jgi:hypothetical protein
MSAARNQWLIALIRCFCIAIFSQENLHVFHRNFVGIQQSRDDVAGAVCRQVAFYKQSVSQLHCLAQEVMIGSDRMVPAVADKLWMISIG